jgi:hypothetical protein
MSPIESGLLLHKKSLLPSGGWLKKASLGIALVLTTARMGVSESPLEADAVSRARSASQARIAADLSYLASDELKGRDTGSAEIEIAAEYIGKRFAELGFNTQLYDGTPFQSFVALTETTAGPDAENYLILSAADGTAVRFESNRSFRPMSLGSSGAVKSGVVFVGYGITAPDANFDEYAGLDVNGKVVIVLRGEPRRGRQDSALGAQQPTRYALFNAKIANAIAHGAAAVLLVNHEQGTQEGLQSVKNRLDEQTKQLAEIEAKLGSLPEAAVNTRNKLLETQQVALGQLEALQKELELAPEGLLTTNQGGSAEGDKQIPVATIGRESFAKFLAMQNPEGESRTLVDIELAIDESMQPASFELQNVAADLQTGLIRNDVVAKNVLGELPGVGNLAEETIVIGAHYDHVGMGGAGSLAPGTIAIHNGADDNGSGTVTMLELAYRFAEAAKQARENDDQTPRRRIVFMAFTAEERGLLGSKHYAREPRFPLESTVTMINLDMVGRLNDDEGLTIYGVESSPVFDGLIDQWNSQHQLPVIKDPSGYGPSDHTSFYEKGVPVMFFFTGLHSDYHRPSDDFEKINVEGMVRITDMVYQAAQHFATVAERPQYQKTGPGAGIRRGGNRTAYLGVSMEEQGTVVMVSALVDGGPAAKAGLQIGDTIVQVGGEGMNRIADVQRIINNKRPGDKLSLLVLRNNEEMTVEVTLERRPE